MVATSAQTVRDEVAELLGVSADDVDPGADLIASGLDSIRMMSLSGRWRKQGINVGFAALAANPTVAAWIELVAEHTPDAPAEESAAETGDAGDDGEPFPLAPIQHAFWVGRNQDQQLGGVGAHLYVEFDGAGVDPQRLQAAATKLAARHPMLRVEILPDGTQRIGERPLPVTVHDLRDLDEAAALAQLDLLRESKSHQMLHDEVLQLSLSLLPGGRTRLHVDMDMQCADAVSYRNFMADLAAFYRGVDLPDLGYTYREYRAKLTASVPPPSQEDLRWWADRVPDLPDPPALPLVPLSDQRNPHRSIRLWETLDVPTRDALFAAAHRRGITPAMAVGASYANALARWSTQSRFLLNLPMFGREPYHPDVDKLVGDFTSSLLLDIDLTGADTAMARARVVQETLHATAAHSSVSGLDVLRDMSRHRGSQTLATIVYTSALGLGDLFAGDVTEHFGAPVWTISQGPQVLIDAQATPIAEGLMINWDVRVEAFRPGVAEAMFAYHLAELRRLATDDAAWDAADPPAASEQQRRVRAELNSSTSTPSGDLLHAGFLSNAAATPDAPAVFSSAGNLTYAELQDKVLAVAAALQSRGVCRGEVVAVLGPKSVEQVIALLAISMVGAAYLPVGVDQPADRATRILHTGEVDFALICGSGSDHPALPHLTVADAEIIGDPAHFEPVEVTPEDLAYVLFTSGSTGEPKGVEITHDAAMNTIEFINDHFEIGPADRCLALSHLECDLSVIDVYGTLRSGGSMVVVDEEHRRDPDVWVKLIDEHQVSVLHFLTGWLEMLVAGAAGASGTGGGPLSSLRVVPTGGDWVRPDLVRALRAASPRVRFAGLGGATETATHNTIFEVGFDDDALPAHWTSVPFGVPLTNNCCRVVDARGEDCPDWVPGELWVGGRGIARGYRGRPDLTAERFVEYDGRRWYRTGDLVRSWPDGTLEFVGRADHRIKVSGFRIELGEVEGALCRVPGVDAAVAVLVPVDGGHDVLGAVVRADQAGAEEGLDPESVAESLAELVPAHMIPQVLLVADEIPYSRGKTDRTAVVRMLSAVGAPESRGYRAPSDPLETALCAIVGDVLGQTGVGVDDDFFALGGDSVLGTQLVARIRDWLDTSTVMVADVFAARTVAQMAALLAGREAGSDRLQLVSELYLEVTGMDSADVTSELARTSPEPAFGN
ncbi:non-ribosomal peptide synthetase [Mycolicibacterium boenickei]|uniref:Phenyloxazoline synthase MbtB n=1 Tax=Mycolicibacterium boenickei TaxID=146017 RepID=A0AAX3A2E5_9MYCO|nr:non-ribosomal peptide synthetase [Mycolicibacterium boenickei]PEG60112.1 non-ribosomal peptide synthetase [Mycolicibacterium boenickei]UNC01878.1 non-ribosomal peptide synthetase [Mycolicibacterium boenickei]BBX91811.1 phenyloxazoline synthase MbtB [Mycolicibacterium boenickei]